MIAAWVKNYIGIPFVEKGSVHTGCDCYGLIRLIYKEHFNIDLTDFTSAYSTTKDSCAISKIIEKETILWEKVRDEKEGDVTLFRIKNMLWHVGFIVEKNMMLHTMEGCVDSCIERIDSLLWKNRLEGFYRFNG